MIYRLYYLSIKRQSRQQIQALSSITYCVLVLLSMMPVSKLWSQQSVETFPKSLHSSFVSSLLPVPQKQALTAKTFVLQHDWQIDSMNEENKSAYTSILEGLGKKPKGFEGHETNDRQRKAGHWIHFSVKEGLVAIGTTTDTNKTEILKQAYRLNLSDTAITIEANAAQGLFYGAQTLLQLVRKQGNKLLLPEGEIVDWPDLNVRMIYWDDAHHLEKPGALKEAIRQAAYYKINAFALKLEGHFEFAAAPEIVEPYAMSAAEYQELSYYARSYFIELVPYLDAPGHVSFILKHPEYAHLRAFPNSNYELSVTNPGTDTLLLHLLDELMNANKGGKYILLCYMLVVTL